MVVVVVVVVVVVCGGDGDSGDDNDMSSILNAKQLHIMFSLPTLTLPETYTPCPSGRRAPAGPSPRHWRLAVWRCTPGGPQPAAVTEAGRRPPPGVSSAAS